MIKYAKKILPLFILVSVSSDVFADSKINAGIACKAEKPSEAIHLEYGNDRGTITNISKTPDIKIVCPVVRNSVARKLNRWGITGRTQNDTLLRCTLKSSLQDGSRTQRISLDIKSSKWTNKDSSSGFDSNPMGHYWISCRLPKNGTLVKYRWNEKKRH